jgi:hypothetical protein
MELASGRVGSHSGDVVRLPRWIIEVGWKGDSWPGSISSSVGPVSRDPLSCRPAAGRAICAPNGGTERNGSMRVPVGSKRSAGRSTGSAEGAESEVRITNGDKPGAQAQACRRRKCGRVCQGSRGGAGEDQQPAGTAMGLNNRRKGPKNICGAARASRGPARRRPPSRTHPPDKGVLGNQEKSAWSAQW